MTKYVLITDGFILYGLCSSLCFSLLIVASYLIFHDLRKLRYVELLTYAAITNAVFASCPLLGRSHEGQFACYYQGIIGSASCVSGALWMTVITYQLYIACVHGKVLGSMKWYRIGSVVGPLIVACSPLITNNFAPDGIGGFCFVKTTGMYIMWRVLSCFLWILLGVILQIALLLLTFRRLYTTALSGDTSSKVWESAWKLTLYPCLYIVCWSPQAYFNLRPMHANFSGLWSEVALVMLILNGSIFGATFFLLQQSGQRKVVLLSPEQSYLHFCWPRA